MAIVSEMRLSVTRTVNLGNYESVKIEAAVVMHREEGEAMGSRAKEMREDLMDEVRNLLDAATEEYVPMKKGDK